MSRPRIACAVVAILGWASSSCAGGLHSASLVDSVRILVTSADEPYAKPGDTVNLQILAVDERPTKPAPMIVSWIPIPCVNPADDAYYNCFEQFARAAIGGSDAGARGDGGGTGGACVGGTAGDGGADADAGADAGASADAGAGASADAGAGAGADAGAGTPIPAGVDLTPFLQTGPSFQFTMPCDAVMAHARIPPPTTQYGLAILFNVACAGHVELVPLDPNNVQAPPIGCFDDHGNRLGPDAYVVGFTRIYAYNSLTNRNPAIDHIDVAGKEFDFDVADTSHHLTQGVGLSHCVDGSSCPSVKIGPVVLPDSQETVTMDQSGMPTRKEQIWADFYTTLGSFSSDARLLYDTTIGSLGSANDTDNDFQPPNAPGDGTIWIVVHDDRGGATWVTVPLHVM